MSEQTLTIRAFEEAGHHVLVLSGELDLAGVPGFEAAAARLRELGAREMHVDITDVGFIDSSGVRAILAVKAACASRGCEFTMTHGGEHSERIFEITRLLEHLPFRSRKPQRFRREIELSPSQEDADERTRRPGG